MCFVTVRFLDVCNMNFVMKIFLSFLEIDSLCCIKKEHHKCYPFVMLIWVFEITLEWVNAFWVNYSFKSCKRSC